MINSIEVLQTPDEFAALRERDLSRTTCVVFDVLRATTTMITALRNGAEAVVPVAEISEALELRAKFPAVLLGGERGGLRITAAMTGGVEFDLGNSPREFLSERACGRTIVMTTTNGTRALRACVGARRVWLGGFVTLDLLAERIRRDAPDHLLLVCAGTHDESALEDVLAAGALCDSLWPEIIAGGALGSAQKVRAAYLENAHDLLNAVRHSTNGRRLLSMPQLAPDVPISLERNSVPLLAELRSDGRVVRVD